MASRLRQGYDGQGESEGQNNERNLHMKIERSSSTRGDATTTPGGLRRLVWLLFLVAAAIASVKVDAVRAVASPRANQGRAGVGYALPANVIVVTNTNDTGPGSL